MKIIIDTATKSVVFMSEGILMRESLLNVSYSLSGEILSIYFRSIKFMENNIKNYTFTFGSVNDVQLTVNNADQYLKNIFSLAGADEIQ